MKHLRVAASIVLLGLMACSGDDGTSLSAEGDGGRQAPASSEAAGRFEAPIGAQLPGSGIGPAGTPSPDGTIYYATDGSDGPRIRVHRPDGEESVLTDGYSPIVDGRGDRLAFGRATPESNSSTLLTSNLGDWSEHEVAKVDGIVQPIFWAGDTLVALRYDPMTTTQTALFVVDGRVADERPVAPKAVSPDGSRIVVFNPTVESYLQVLDARTLEPVAAMDMGAFIDGFVDPERARTIDRGHVPNTAEEDPLPVALGDNLGVWEGDTIVLVAYPAPIVARLDGDKLSPVGVLALPSVEDGIERHVVTVRSESPNEVVARWLELSLGNLPQPSDGAAAGAAERSASDRHVAYVCDLSTLACRDGGEAALDRSGPVWATSR